MVVDTTNMLDDALEYLYLSFTAVPDICTTVQYLVCIYSGSSCLCYVEYKYFSDVITSFTYGLQNVTGIGGNVDIVGSGTSKWNSIYIKGHSKKFQVNGYYITCLGETQFNSPQAYFKMECASNMVVTMDMI